MWARKQLGNSRTKLDRLRLHWKCIMIWICLKKDRKRVSQGKGRVVGDGWEYGVCVVLPTSKNQGSYSIDGD